MRKGAFDQSNRIISALKYPKPPPQTHSFAVGAGADVRLHNRGHKSQLLSRCLVFGALLIGAGAHWRCFSDVLAVLRIRILRNVHQGCVKPSLMHMIDTLYGANNIIDVLLG